MVGMESQGFALEGGAFVYFTSHLQVYTLLYCALYNSICKRSHRVAKRTVYCISPSVQARHVA